MNHYRIVPKDDELYHWKYVRKEKLPNGKWKYYYKTSAVDKFKWGYKMGSMTDVNGKPLSKDFISPRVYRRQANVKYKQYQEHNTPFYRGYETHNVRTAMKSLEKQGVALETKVAVAESFVAKLGQFTGRTVAGVKYNTELGKKYVKEYLKNRA